MPSGVGHREAKERELQETQKCSGHRCLRALATRPTSGSMTGASPRSCSRVIDAFGDRVANTLDASMTGATARRFQACFSVIDAFGRWPTPEGIDHRSTGVARIAKKTVEAWPTPSKASGVGHS